MVCDVLLVRHHRKLYCLYFQLKGNLLIHTEKSQVCAKGTWEDSKSQRKWEHDARKIRAPHARDKGAETGAGSTQGEGEPRR